MSGLTCPKCGLTSHNSNDVRNRYCGHCHVFIDALLCFRVYVDEVLASEWWTDPFEPPGRQVAQMAERQAELCKGAGDRGQRWRLEIWDPSEDRTFRLGSSEQGMVQPIPIDLDDDGTSLMRKIAEILGYLG